MKTILIFALIGLAACNTFEKFNQLDCHGKQRETVSVIEKYAKKGESNHHEDFNEIIDLIALAGPECLPDDFYLHERPQGEITDYEHLLEDFDKAATSDAKQKVFKKAVQLFNQITDEHELNLPQHLDPDNLP